MDVGGKEPSAKSASKSYEQQRQPPQLSNEQQQQQQQQSPTPTGGPTTPESAHGPSPLSEPVSITNVCQRLELVSERIVQIVLPVTLCALYCCMLIRMLSKNMTLTQANLLDSTWRQLGVQVAGDVVITDTTVSTNVTSYLIVVAVFCILIVLVTLLILFIFYMEWQQCLIYYFYLPSVVILALVTPAFFRTIIHSFNLFAIDIFTVILLTWNFTALGMMSIFSLYAPAPLCLQQFYLIHNSAMLSVLIIHALPGWAPWLLLAFLVLWDLFAVLAPFGPLNLILDMAEKKGIVEMPGLIYSTDSLPQTPPVDESARESEASSKQSTPSQHHEPTDTPDERVSPSQSDVKLTGVNIGLGDFIFYSLLIGLTSKGRDQNDFYTVLTTLNSVQFGLVLTLLILALTRRALPALPISIGLGLSVAVLTIQFVPQLSNSLASASIFV